MSESRSSGEQEIINKILGVIGLVFLLAVLVILISRFVFWLSVVSFFLSIMYLIAGIFLDRERMSDYDESYFDGFPHSLLAIGLIILFWVLAHFTFPIGYSKLSYEIIDWNNQYQELMSLPVQITIEALNQTCQAIPDYEYCGTILASYQTAQKVEEISGLAKSIQFIFDLRYAY